MVQTYDLVYERAELLELPVKQVFFIAVEIAIPATAVMCGVSLGMSGRKALGWGTSLALLVAWAGGLTLLAATAIAGEKIAAWMWLVSLGVPSVGAFWLGIVTRNTIGRRPST